MWAGSSRLCSHYTAWLACVASVSSRGSSRKLGEEKKKKWMTPSNLFFASAISRLETLATQATAWQLLRLAPIQKPYQIGLMFTHIRTVIPEWFLKPRGVVIKSPECTQDSQKQTLSNIFPTKNASQLIPITHDEIKRWEILKTPWPLRTCRFYGETVHALFFMDQL